MIRELETLSKTLSEIECFRNDIQNPMKLAQTRLEGRNERCSAELCFDDAQQTLHNEVEVWNAAQNAIRQRLTNSR